MLAPAMAARFGPLGSGAQEAADRVSALTGKQTELVGTLKLVTGRLAGVAGAYGTDGLAGAMALAAVAGVKVSQLLSKDKTVWAGALQQIDGVVQGYANMGVGATNLGNAINVLTIAQSDQLKNMESLNTAFDQFDKIVSGPVSGFISFANTLKRFSSDAGVAGASISGLGTGMKGVSKKVTDASLQLQSDFQDTFNSATQMADAMRLTGVASGKQVAAIKEVVQVMIPMAGSNRAAAAEISALAQEAGGPATTNLKKLGEWAGKTHDPLRKAQKAAADAAVSFFDMSKDAQKLGTTLSQDLTKDMSAAVQNAVGLQGAMNDFAKSVHNGTQATASGHAARQKLVDDLAAVGIAGPQANSIIKAISSQLDVNGRVAAATHKARQSINDDLQTIIKRGPVVRQDLMNMTKAIVDHGIKSDAEKGARQKLIDDLHATGLKSKDATGLVDGLIRKLQHVPKKVSTDIEVHAGGSGTVHVFAGGLGAGGQGNVRFTSGAARGMYVDQGSTPTADDVLIRASKGELVVPTNMVAAGEVDHLRGRIPGFRTGGFVGLDAGIASGPRKVAGLEVKFAGQMLAAWAKKAIAAAKAAMGGDGGSIVSYAKSLLGKIPYVWGGTSLSGADCSGFTGLVYRHAGYRNIPRTSEAQGAWVDATPQPQAGGLAFYHSPPGGPDPGHVGIIDNGGSRVISQGGGMGPKMMGLHAMPLLWTGIPPGGFKGGNIGAPANRGRFTWTQLEQLWTKAGGRAGAAGSMASIAIAESGGDPNAHNPSGATGLWQILGNPFPGNAFDPLTNARMAVAKYKAGGFYPWISDPVAARLIAHGITRAKGGLVPGYAGGGTVAGLRSRLASEQRPERAKYAGLVRSFMTGPAKDRTKSVMSELKTLAARQRSEQSAYAAVAGGGLSDAELHHLAAAARAEIRTASDQSLNKKHPLFAKDLRKYLAQISATSSGDVTGGGTGGGRAPAPTPALRSKLAAAQAGERAKYFGLGHSFATGPAKYRTKLTMQELSTLAKRQASELSAYRKIAGSGFTRSNLSKLGSAARGELRTASDKEISRNQGAGGHPLWAADLRKYLARISTLTGTPVKAAGPPPGSVLSGGVTEHIPGSVKDIHLGPAHTVNGGVLKFDRGGQWPSGMLGVNTSGRTETVIPPGAGSTGGDIHLHLTVNGPVGSQAELEDWYVRTANKMARTGRLSQAVKTAGR
jgi:cell wall-associated NlpC family hydrolase